MPTVRPPRPRTVRNSVRAPSGENRDFRDELIALRPELRARALRLTKSASSADDLVQDTFERALRCHQQFERGTSLRAWLQAIAFSIFVTGYRRKRRESVAASLLTGDPCAWTSRDDENPAMHHLSPALSRAVDALPDGYRFVLFLVDVYEYNYREAGETLGIPLGTVMSRLHRARRKLASTLEPSREAA